MLLKPWDELPERLKNPEVRKYYEILEKKKPQLVVKRGFDVVASSLALAAFAPMLAAIAAAIKLDSKGPVFYRQKRITQFGKAFKIHKFRSMFDGADSGSSVTVRGDSRITKVGAFIREHKLDELSQLIDVLEGKMTFVGTRPEVEKYVEVYTDEMLATLLLPAGITSSASVEYRDENKLINHADNVDRVYVEKIMPDKMKYNLFDIEHFSLIHEAKILARTGLVLLTGDRPVKREKPLVAVVTNNDDDIYCFRKELIEALVENGYSVLISCPWGEKLSLMDDIEYTYDDPEIDRRGTSVINDGRLAAHYFDLFRKKRPDVVLTYTAKPNIYASTAAKLLGIPVINNVTGFGSVLKMSEAMQGFVMLMFKAAWLGSKHIFFQNETNMRFAEEIDLVKAPHSLIPGSGVNVEKFFPQSYPDDDVVSFNYIGRVLKDKGVDDYIEAARRIRKTHPQTQFNILGFIEPTEAHYEAELKRLEEDGIVRYLGSQKDVRPFIAASHATIHPSVYGEGMSNVLLESAASARPIITTDNPGCRETVKDGETGFIYPGGDVDALVEKIEHFLSLSNDERKEMGIMGRAYIAENFSRKKVVDAYIKEINNICKRG